MCSVGAPFWQYALGPKIIIFTPAHKKDMSEMHLPVITYCILRILQDTHKSSKIAKKRGKSMRPEKYLTISFATT